jgi:HEAT repeat protein
MGLMRKMVRRSVRSVTPRPVRQVNRVVRHPVRTSVRAVTPQPIRQVQRSVFNVTHPVNTAENASLDTLSGRGRRARNVSRRRPSRAAVPSAAVMKTNAPTASAASPPSGAGDDDVRYEAVRTLEERASADTREPLLQATRDRDGMVRKVAVRGLARLNDPRDTELFVKALADPDEDVRYEAIHVLEDRVTPELREPLLAAMRDDDGFVRRIALRAVSRLNDPRDTDSLVKALADPDEDVRYEAIRALEDRLTPELREPLLGATKDSVPDVRSVAVEALATLAAQEAETAAGAYKPAPPPPPQPPEEDDVTPPVVPTLRDHDPADLVLAMEVSTNDGILDMTVRELLAVLDRQRLTDAALDELEQTLYDAGLRSDPEVEDLDLDRSVRLTRQEVIPEFELRSHVEQSGPWTLRVEDLLRAFDRSKLTDRAREDIDDALDYAGLSCNPSIRSVERDDSVTLSRADSR